MAVCFITKNSLLYTFYFYILLIISFNIKYLYIFVD